MRFFRRSAPHPPDHHGSETSDAVFAGLLALHCLERCFAVAQVLGVLPHPVELADELSLPVVVDLGDELAVGVDVLTLQSWYRELGEDHLTTPPRFTRVVRERVREREGLAGDGNTAASTIEERRHLRAVRTESQRRIEHRKPLEEVAAARDVDGGDLQRRHRDPVDHRDVRWLQTTGVQMSLGVDAPAGLMACRQMHAGEIGKQQ